MIIKLTDSSGGNAVTLVHGPGRATDTYATGPNTPPVFSGTQAVQVTPLTRSPYVQVLPRGNHQGSLPFSALRVFSTLDAARAFAAKHVLDTQALTRLVLEDTAGGVGTKLHGALSSCDAQAKGVAVQINYEFTYGKIETTTGTT